MTLEQGKRLFRDGLYGDALLKFEDAVRDRQDLYARSEQDLVATLSLPEVRRLGDSLQRVEEYVDSHFLIDARRALDELFRVKPRESFGDSVAKALGAFESLKLYPEGYFWMAQTLRVEGELEVALPLYQKALRYETLFEIPDEAREIRYILADIHAARREYNEMEERLLEVLEGDELWSSSRDSFTRDAMLRTIVNEGVDRFLLLYRNRATSIYRAHRDLGLYYYRTGRHDRAVRQLTFAFLIGSSAAIEELRRLDHEFEFGRFSAVLDAGRGRESLRNFFSDTDFYKTMYYLGAAFYANGNRKTATEFWTLLSAREAAGEWRGRSQRQLAAPSVETPTKTP
jgi:tetratricopeptide (TPR) repeat protein